MDFISQLHKKIEFVDEILNKYMPGEETYPEEIFKAMRYSLFAGGKRIRPILLICACEAMNGDVKKTYAFAAAIEMIHTYSLIHDDLPAMDNDDFRRGVPTNHKVFGEDIAILAGDGLLNTAFEIMLEESFANKDFSMVEAAKIISNAAGTNGMLGGQVVDVLNEGKKIDEKTLDYIHKNKTAAMIMGALKAGAVLGGANEEQVKIIENAGEKIGLAFQIQDDILDVISSDEVLGKPTHSDEKNDKNTYVTMYGLEESKKIVEKLSNEAIELFEGFGEKSEFLIKLTKYLIRREF